MKVKHTVRTASLALSFLLLAQVGTPRPSVVMTLVVDRSGSMAPNAQVAPCLDGTQGGKYLPAAVTAFIDMFDESLDRAALVSFSVSASNDVPMTAPGGAFKTPIINTLTRFNNLWAGGTCWIAGLTNALVIQNTAGAPANTIKVVVFFTDGLGNMTFGNVNGVPLNFGGNDPPSCFGPDLGASFYRTNTSEQSQSSVCTVNCGSATACSVNGTNLTASVFTNAHGVAQFFCASKITEDATNRCVLIANQLRASSNYVYAIGLTTPENSAPPNLTTLQQIANDTNSPTFDPTQPVGAAFLTDGNDLTNVFRQVATEILTGFLSITSPPPVIVNADPGLCTASHVNLGTPSAVSRCSFFWPVHFTNNAPAVFPKGTTVVVWTATDICNNQTTCTQLVGVVDNQSPVILCPTSLVVSCAAAVPSPNPASVTASDNCGSVSVVFIGDTITNQSCPDRYTVLRMYGAIDAANNRATCTQTITVNSTTPPTITAPGDVTTLTDSGQCYASAVTLGSPVTISWCGGPLTITNNAPAVFPKGTTQVIWSATDPCGNTSSATQNVVVADNQPPFVACPANILVTAQDSNGTVVAFSVTASDNCDSNLVASCSPVSSSQFAIGTTPVNCVVIDSAGNTNTCSFSVTVVDSSIFTILSITPQNSDILLSWVMPLGLTGIVQGSADNYGDDFTNVSAPFYTPGNGAVTNTYVDPGGQTNFPQRFYRIRLTP
jgi:hypothetical protein